MSEENQTEEWEVPGETPKKVGWGMVIVVCLIVWVLIGLLDPMILRSAKAGERTEAISNAKQIGLALLEFDQEFGSFPDEKTRVLLLENKETDLDLSGSSSNAMFRQLIAYGLESEEIFFCENPALPTRRPDNKIENGKALEAGEVGFSYIAGLNSSCNPGQPVLCASMIPGSLRFDPEPLQGKAVALRVDNSVKAYSILPDSGRATFGEGKLLLDPENGTWPTGHVIDLRHPEK